MVMKHSQMNKNLGGKPFKFGRETRSIFFGDFLEWVERFSDISQFLAIFKERFGGLENWSIYFQFP